MFGVRLLQQQTTNPWNSRQTQSQLHSINNLTNSVKRIKLSAQGLSTLNLQVVKQSALPLNFILRGMRHYPVLKIVIFHWISSPPSPMKELQSKPMSIYAIKTIENMQNSYALPSPTLPKMNSTALPSN